MSARQILGLLLMCALPFASQAQLSGEAQDETLLASAQIVELDVESSEPLTNWVPPTAGQLESLTAAGLLPLQQEEVQGIVSCAWAGSDTGFACPPGATHCDVVVLGDTVGLQCMSGNQSVSGVYERISLP